MQLERVGRACDECAVIKMDVCAGGDSMNLDGFSVNVGFSRADVSV